MSSIENFFKRIEINPVLCVLRAPSEEVALKCIEACVSGGLNNIEITLSTPNALKVLKKAKQIFPEAIFGIGTITNLTEAQSVLDPDVDFYISPHSDSELISFMQKQKVIYIPGAGTPTELMHIYNQGLQIQKLFPGSLHGAKGVSALLAPMPFLNLIVTGGVSLENAFEFLNAGARAICVGGNLFKSDFISQNDFQALKEEARKWSQITSFK